MQELIDQAHKLGEALAAHPKVQAFIAAQAAVNADEPAQQILRDYAETAERVEQLEQAQQPIEPADKQKLAALNEQVSGNDTLKELMRTQADYIDLMDRINDAMQAPLKQAGDAAQ